MDRLVTYRLVDSVATVAMDDGKVNVLSLAMLTQLDEALDRAADDAAVVVLSGRERVLSAGFDLAALRSGGSEGLTMLRSGFELAHRLLSFPTPVVIACTGHAIAMGVFLLLSGDYRIGASGPYKITANEVAIGMTLPHAAIEICRQRLAPAHFNRAVVLAEVYSPDNAIEAGFVDRVVTPDAVHDTAREVATELAKLDMAAHAATKQRARGPALQAIRAAIETEFPAPS
jgi:enoyl-CoA hydratase